MRPRHVAAAALSAATTLSVTALALAQTDTPQATAAAGEAGAPTAQVGTPAAARPTIRIRDRRLRFDQPVVVRGDVRSAVAGTTVVLQHAPTGERWRAVARTRARPDGRYRLRARLRDSGAVRVVVADRRAAAAARLLSSRTRRVAVAAQLVVRPRRHDVRAGGAVRVNGVLMPRDRHRRVTVDGHVDGRWRALAHARTKANGHFSARVVARSLGATKLRVRSEGTRANAAVVRDAGVLRGYRASLASWYWLYGSPLACGGTLGYSQLGVAHKSLPCGTKVTIRYNGRQVTVPVVDRGPYVGAREWDLTGATARALGFDGVGTVWTTV